MTKGILIIACGHNADAMALRLFRSLVVAGCTLPIHIHRSPFHGGRESRAVKVNMAELTPFDLTLYLDCDMLAVRSPTKILGDMEANPHLQVCMVQDTATPKAGDMYLHPFYKKELTPLGYRLLGSKTCSGDTHWNTGMIAFRKEAWPLFTKWESEWREDFEASHAFPLDESHMMSAIRALDFKITQLEMRYSVPCNIEKPDEWITKQIDDGAVMLHLCGEKKRENYERMTRLMLLPRPPSAPDPGRIEDKARIVHGSTLVTKGTYQEPF